MRRVNVLQRKDKDGSPLVVNGQPSWRLRWEVRDAATGKRRYAYETYHGSRREASRYWQRRWAEIEEHGRRYRKPEREALRQYLDGWLERAKPDLRATTAETYARAVNVHITPAIGGVPLADLTSEHVQEMIDKMRAGTGPEGYVVGAPTIRYARRILGLAMKDATERKLIRENPVHGTRGPKEPPRHIEAFTVAQAQRLFKEASGSRIASLLEFTWLTAMRRGEVCALRWADADLDGATATVRRSLVKLGTGKTFHDPKTEAGIRTIVLPKQAVDALRRQKVAQAKDKLRWGPRYQNSDLIFANRFGEALHPEDVSRRFRELRDRAKLPRLPFHALRHSGASVQIAAGVPLEIVSKRLGHRNVATTADLYGHLLQEADRAAAAKLDAFLGKSKRRAH